VFILHIFEHVNTEQKVKNIEIFLKEQTKCLLKWEQSVKIKFLKI
jgi:hypothetical protein